MYNKHSYEFVAMYTNYYWWLLKIGFMNMQRLWSAYFSSKWPQNQMAL